MRLPRDLDGVDLAQALGQLGYVKIRQTGSHIRLTTEENGVHHVTIPCHSPLKPGTLNAILRDVAEHFGMSRDGVLARILK